MKIGSTLTYAGLVHYVKITPQPMLDLVYYVKISPQPMLDLVHYVKITP